MSGGASVRTLTEAERPIADLLAVLPPAHAGRLLMLLRDSRRKRARSRART